MGGRLVYRGETGTHNNVTLPKALTQPSITIHSHPNDNNACYPGPDDPDVFLKYGQNIIVGPIFADYNNNMVKGDNTIRYGLAFYPSNITKGQAPCFIMSIRLATKITDSRPNHIVDEIMKIEL